MSLSVWHRESKALPAHYAGPDRVCLLQQQLVRFSFFNLLLVACVGVLLRLYVFVPGIPFAYKNLLHGHSHFAFGGWVMPILLALILKSFPQLTAAVAYRHWRNIAVLLLASAYGMLVAFPLQGYKAVSIAFSTLSVAAGFYMAVVLRRPLRQGEQTTSVRFLQAGLFYLLLSAIGPFATGPLIAMGKAGTPVYYNAVYFYLHFQYNGWFTFAVLALLYKFLEEQKAVRHGALVFRLMHIACIPAYFLSVLWNEPSAVFYMMGGGAALLQVVALGHLWKDAGRFGWAAPSVALLFRLALAAFALKTVLQLLSALPVVAQLAATYRNFVIAYLHLVLLGFVSLFFVAATVQRWRVPVGAWVKGGLALFLFSFITTELLLAGNALGGLLHFSLPAYTAMLLMCSLFFPVGLILLCNSVYKLPALQQATYRQQ